MKKIVPSSRPLPAGKRRRVRGKELFFSRYSGTGCEGALGALVSIYLSENYGRKLSLWQAQEDFFRALF
jgi:hypothetical protein